MCETWDLDPSHQAEYLVNWLTLSHSPGSHCTPPLGMQEQGQPAGMVLELRPEFLAEEEPGRVLEGLAQPGGRVLEVV